MNLSSFLFLFFFLLTLTHCGQPVEENISPASDPADKPIPVRVARVIDAPEPVPLTGTGLLSSKESVPLSFKVGGIIEKLAADEGDRVRKGQLLARLDRSEINARVRQAESQVAKLERDLQRVENLYRDTVATLEQVQNLETAVEVARADLQVARFNQQHAEIYAPANGRVLKRLAEEAEIVSPGRPVLLLSSTTNNLVLRLGLPDVEVVRLALGDTARLQVQAYPGQRFPARVSQIAETATPGSGLFEVELSVDARGRSLRDGFIARAEIFPSQQPAVFALPMDAIVEGDGREVLVFFRKGKDQVRPEKLKVQEILNDQILVMGNEEMKNAEIITDGGKYLDAQSRITVVQ